MKLNQHLQILAFLCLFLFSWNIRAQIVISEFNADNQVELLNLGTDTVDISDYWLCNFPDYDQLSTLTILCGSLNLAPGDTVAVSTILVNIDATDGELGLYIDSNFPSSGSIIDYVEWGSSGHGRSGVAVTAGIWTSGTSVPAFGPAESLVYDGEGETDSDWGFGTSTVCVSSETEVNIYADPNLGKILTDGAGRTLYYFSRDAAAGASACTGGCLNLWPVFYAENLAAGNGLDAADFDSFQRADGSMQTTYKGWPLYYFANDAAAGETNGEAFNNVWYVAKPDYHIMLLNNTLTGLDGVTYNSSYEPGEETVQYFVDAQGRTIYIFINDEFNTNNFTIEDFGNNGVWPIYEETMGAIPSTLDADLFGTIDVFGRQQLTYKGWPLYYFGQDATRGETKGVSVPVPGIWPVAVADLEEAPAPATTVQLSEDAALGQILTDGEGRTLYYFSRDAAAGASACTGGCLNLWPVFYAENLAAGNGLDAADFDSFQRADGSMQTTYKGWPLYYFANDAAAGETNGEAFNNVWYVAKPDYHIMLLNNTLTGLDGVTYNSSYEPGEETVQYFVDAQGRTIYIFINDEFNTNNFTREDFGNNGVWPIYEETMGAIPSTLDADLFGTIDVFGRQQLTYKGWPLYYFGQDATRGETKGVSVPVPGIWPVAVADLETAPAPEAGTALLQVIHAADSRTVDVYLNGSLIKDDFAYRTATPYLEVPAGMPFTIALAPANSTSAEEPMIEQEFFLEAEASYILTAFGNFDSTLGFPVQLALFEGARTTAENSTDISWLFFHGSPDASEVDLLVNGNPAVDDAAYGSYGNGYINQLAEAFILDLTPGDDPQDVVRTYEGNFGFWKGKTAVIFATELLSDGTFEPWVALSNGGTYPLLAVPATPNPLIPEYPEQSLGTTALAVYPNPVADRVSLSYVLNSDARVKIDIFDLHGRLVKNSMANFQEAGQYLLEEELNDLDSGLYLFRIQIGEQILQKRFVKQ